ncbi:SPFH/Band 7/PHB domain-containing membrane-associated protein family [Hibiscus syriacus]|uniref:SPFH/Band 7/PHB domain-containing membrane-associated protein family n=1 Tax=Hibiscus syriacus TaxID=106335 RepID=A0A6A2YJG0_HIBSY|nr:uncharacterized protein LOC120164234 [Hibiscus syriacus]KAE8677427.1 SPFH/Band 7/PHB domain-containing membrane-associated protein family [Hibiscus syriacus]
MACCWSAENATKAYLRAVNMGRRGKEPGVAEFMSAIAAGNNAQLMVMTCAKIVGSTALALVAAARQTGGRVVCILNSLDYFEASKCALRNYGDCISFVIGDAKKLLNDYRNADFVLIDCNITDHKTVLKAAQEGAKHGGSALIVGYNALRRGPAGCSSSIEGFRTYFLPIGEGLLVIRKGEHKKGDDGVNPRKRSHWVVKIDKWTGEEHVFRINSPFPKDINA